MHYIMSELLTTDEMRAIDKMPMDKALALLHYCADERLGLMTVKEYNESFGMPRRTIYDLIDREQLKVDVVCGVTAIIMNDKF